MIYINKEQFVNIMDTMAIHHEWVTHKNATVVYGKLIKLWRELSDKLGDDHPLTQKTLRFSEKIIYQRINCLEN